MAQFIFEGRGKGQRTAHEEIARRNIYHAFNWIVGGYYNSLLDGDTGCLPKDRDELANTIYQESMNHLYREGMESFGRAPKEMRFAGEKFCRAYIDWKLDHDSDVKEIAEAANW